MMINKVIDSTPGIMGILNVTPDSFSDGGKYVDVDTAVEHALQMVTQGANIIDVGGESTRPGADEVSIESELERVLPVITALRQQSDVTISIDTSKSEVMYKAVEAGADMINDVAALRLDGALQAACDLNVPVCLMHMQGEPRTMQHSPRYNHGVVDEVVGFLAERIDVALAEGISKDKLIVDPGFGFGKTKAHNYQLLGGLDQFRRLGVPVLVGISRKSMIGQISDCDVKDRLPGSLAAAVIAVLQGASILRVHDVAPTVQAIAVLRASLTE